MNTRQQINILFCFLIINFYSINSYGISSTSNGGYWGDTLTWVGHVIPSSGDNVTINGPVSFNGNISVGSLTINSGGNLENLNSTSKIVSVTNNFVNYGVLLSDNYSFSIINNISNHGTLPINTTCYGDLANYGNWSGSVTIKGSGIHIISGSYSNSIYLSAGTLVKGSGFELLGSLNLSGNDFDISGGTLILKNAGQIHAGHIRNISQLIGLNSMNYSSGYFYSPGGGILTIGGSVYLWKSTDIVGNCVIQDTLRIHRGTSSSGDNTVNFRGDLRNEGMVYNGEGTYSYDVEVEGKFTNIGDFTPTNTDLLLEGDVENNGIISVSQIKLTGSVEQEISGVYTTGITGSNSLNKIKVVGDLELDNYFYLGDDTLNMDQHVLILKSAGRVYGGDIRNVSRIKGEGCTYHSNGRFYSPLGGVLTLEGSVYLWKTTDIVGDCVIQDTLRIYRGTSSSGDNRVNFRGDLRNEGMVYNEGGTSFYNIEVEGKFTNIGDFTPTSTGLLLEGDIENTGIINVSGISLTGNVEQEISGIYTDPITSSNSLNKIKAVGGLELDNRFSLGDDTLNMDQHVLILKSAGRVYGGDIRNVSRIKGEGCTYYSNGRFYSPLGGVLTFEGSVYLWKNTKIVGDCIVQDTLRIYTGINSSGENKLNINGDLTNYGKIYRGGGSYWFDVEIEGELINLDDLVLPRNIIIKENLTNGGYIQASQIELRGDSTQYVYLVGDTPITTKTKLYANISGSSFIWYKENIQISTGSILTFSNISSQDYGEYEVVSNTGASRKIIIERKVIINSISPQMVALDNLTVFKVKGYGLLDSMAYWIHQCANIQELAGGSFTERCFSCTPMYDTGIKDGLIKDEPQGDILLDFQILVDSIVPQFAYVQPSVSILHDTTVLSIVGANLEDGLMIMIEDFNLLSSSSTGNQLEQKISGIALSTGMKRGEIRDSSGNYLLYEFEVEVVNPSSDCEWEDLPLTHWAYHQIQTLCGMGLVEGQGGTNKVEPDHFLNKAELAKLAYLSACINNSFAEDFPNPFNDLQDESLWYFDYVITLAFLEYDNGVLPFDWDGFNFYPSHALTKGALLKVLIETWDLPIDLSGNQPFTDITAETPHYNYIHTAYNLDILSYFEIQNLQFSPNQFVTRAEAFEILYRLVTNSSIAKPTISDEDFFLPENYTPVTLSRSPDVSRGNFNSYSKTSFVIPGIGFDLNFEHFYNSYLTSLPSEFFKMKPLGNGWSHTYNAYLMEVEGDSIYGEDKIVIFWPDASIHVYKENNNGGYSCESIGVYNQLIRIGNKYEIVTKTQDRYSFQKPNNGLVNDYTPFLLHQIEDPNSNRLELEYEAGVTAGTFNLINVKDESNRMLTFQYGGGGILIQSVTDPIGRVIQFNYNEGYSGTTTQAASDLTSFIDAKGNTTSYKYFMEAGSEHLLKRILLPEGNAIANQYHQRRLIASENSGTGTSLTLTHSQNYTNNNSSDFNTTHITDALNRTTTINRDNLGNVTSSQSLLGSTNFQYNITGQAHLPSQITSIDNVQKNIQYDNLGNITDIYLPEGVEHHFTYNNFNDILQYTNPNGYITSYTYDNNGNLISITSPDNNTIHFNVSSQGLINSITNSLGTTTNYTYDNNGNRVGTSAPLGINKSSNFDGIGRTLNVTNPENQVNTYLYDNNDNVVKETNAMGYLTQYGYDDNDNLVAVTNAKGFSTNLTYNDLDLVSSQSFQNYTSVFTYKDDGRKESETTPNGHTFNYSYDNAGRLIDDGYANYSYNINNQIKTITKDGKDIVLGYDGLNRITSTTYDNHTILYSYDLASNVSSITYESGKVVQYTYTDDNLLETVTDWNGNTTSYNYNSDNTLEQVAFPNGVMTNYEYDVLSRNTSIFTQSPIGDTICYYQFTLDKVGNHIAYQEINSANDSLDISILEKHYSYDNANRITAGTGNNGFQHDDNGNMISNNGVAYTFDAKNNLINRANTSYEYDGLGNRRQKNNNGAITKYVLDVLGMTNVVLEKDENNNVQNYYIYGLGLISRIDNSGNTRYYHGDYRGSTIAITDGMANTTHKYAYSPFGEIWVEEEGDFNTFRYVGTFGVQYEEEDLYFIRARYYDAKLGRFISEDPVWNVNLYPYAVNNPFVYYDLNGLDADFINFTLEGRALAGGKMGLSIGKDDYGNTRFFGTTGAGGCTSIGFSGSFSMQHLHNGNLDDLKGISVDYSIGADFMGGGIGYLGSIMDTNDDRKVYTSGFYIEFGIDLIPISFCTDVSNTKEIKGNNPVNLFFDGLLWEGVMRDPKLFRMINYYK